MNTNIKDYGAKADSAFLNTEAIQKAIDACTESGGGRVTVPSGEYVIGTLRLKSNVELHLEQGAVLVASSCLDDYNETKEYPQNYDAPREKWSGKHLIIAVEQKNVAITGQGKIVGPADAFFGGKMKYAGNFGWRYGFYETDDSIPMRPGQLICFVECEGVTVRDVTLTKSTCWTLLLYGCDFAQVSGVKIFNSNQHANTDGIDIDTCSYVTVSDCIIKTGDDAITFRSCANRLVNEEKRKSKECKYIAVTNCVLSSSCHAFRIGVGEGTIRNISISNIVIKEACTAFQFTPAWGGQGNVRFKDISVSNVTAEDVGSPMSIFTGQGHCMERVSFSDFQCGTKGSLRVNATPGTIRDLTFHNLAVYDLEAEKILPQHWVRDRGEWLFEAQGVDRLTLDNVRVYARDEYFEDRKEFCNFANTTFIKKDITVIHKEEIKSL